MGFDPKEQQRIADNLNCRPSAFPVNYLGMPIRDTRILIKDLDPLVERVKSKAEPWRGKFTFKESKTVLIKSCLASLTMYIMGLYLLPEGVHDNFDKELSHFFWQERNGGQKYNMVKWADLCAPMECGGMCIMASRRMNVALMLRWAWRILRDHGGLWLQLVKAKYLGGARLWHVNVRRGLNFGDPFKP
jgi:hypothetical protein